MGFDNLTQELAKMERQVEDQDNNSVLIHCDDDLEYLQMFKHVLEKTFPGSTVLSYNSPLALLEGINDLPTPRAFICDHCMQPIDGVELLLALEKQFPSVPKFLLSGMTFVSNPVQDFPNTHLLTKGMHLEQVLLTVKDLINL